MSAITDLRIQPGSSSCILKSSAWPSSPRQAIWKARRNAAVDESDRNYAVSLAAGRPNWRGIAILSAARAAATAARHAERRGIDSRSADICTGAGLADYRCLGRFSQHCRRAMSLDHQGRSTSCEAKLYTSALLNLSIPKYHTIPERIKRNAALADQIAFERKM